MMPLPRFAASAAMALILALTVASGPTSSEAGAADGSGAGNGALIDAANEALTGVIAEGDKGSGAARAVFAHARGALIFPGNTGALGVGDGRGLLFARDSDTGFWTGPAIYNVVTGNLKGSPAGPTGRVVFIVRSDVERLIAQRIRLGGSGVSVGVLAGNTFPETDLVALTPAGPAAGPGVTYTDTVLAPDQAATDALYGRPFTIREAVGSTADAGEGVARLRRVLDLLSQPG